MFNFAYSLSFKDATIRKAFSKKQDEEYKDFHSIKCSLKEGLYDDVKTYISYIFDGKANLGTCDEFIIKTCTEAERIDDSFSYGNAQKLINMTAKYMYLSCYENSNLRDLFKYCHCPMDSIMLKYVVNNCSNTETFYLGGKERKMWNSFSWSSLTLSDVKSAKQKGLMDPHHAFQSMVNGMKSDNMNSIEFDYCYYNQM